MNGSVSETWYEANQAYLVAALLDVRKVLESVCREGDDSRRGEEGSLPAQTRESSVDWSHSQPPALETLCSAFDLSSFERKIVLMCAGAEMDSRFAALFAAARQDPRRSQPTFSLALSAFQDAHWSALSPGRPLRRWHLVEVTSGDTMATSPLRIQERVLHYLAGVHCLDERLLAIVRPVQEPAQLAPSHRAVADQIAAVWSQAGGVLHLPIVELCGSEIANKRPVAAVAAALVGLQLHTVPAWGLPSSALEVESFLRLWERESVLSSSALLLECDDAERPETPSASAIAGLLESIRSPVMVSARTPWKCPGRSIVLFDVAHPSQSEQAELWRSTLQPSFPCVNGEVERLVSQFNLSSTAIISAAVQAARGWHLDPAERDPQPDARDGLAACLWDACRVQARPRLEGLAQRIEPAARWDDLVLAESQMRVLRLIAVHVRQRAKVYQTWGFASKGSRGLGISALFAGPSGTGKTMAAEVLANDLCLDLYRIDLSQVVSKYIGETEKNLRRVFDAAEEGAAVLLFDEADALFGKRSEVKDSHDRYANIEVSYLLQRMETYRGLAILTTNRKNALDPAFLRRIRFAVEFPFPEVGQRAEIWRRVFPRLTPTENLKIDSLGRLNASGGNIRNIAIGAAFLAADAGETVRMSHLLSAARSEFAKLEKPLNDSEIAGWI
jgi:AAA+ superfamily predicted ATPase